ncbi:uncharacterized protein LOC130108444 [Lampris incognitus]|uniref:uncharacterized protein LOC130108444 n=1 Tax=Lampris incognitus TaxID=2546036 RepID=UPI0024B537D0|nr:uncharacterized protein LOC130108444 [Lampris incognitus]
MGLNTELARTVVLASSLVFVIGAPNAKCQVSNGADLHLKPNIEILSPIRWAATVRLREHKLKLKPKPWRVRYLGAEVTCKKHISNNVTIWELVCNCVKAEAGDIVNITVTIGPETYRDNYEVPDPVPEFHLSVDPLTKSANLTVKPGAKVYARWCYRKSQDECNGPPHSSLITTDPSQSPSVILNFPFLLPCVCVQVFYTFLDARRNTKCPFQNQTLGAIRDIWHSSEITLYDSSVEWSSECPASNLKPSASLCWSPQPELCTPILNSTLEETGQKGNLKFNISAVDKHPQICVQLSLQDSHHFHCPFRSDVSPWEAHIGAGRQGVFVYLTSSVPARFSAQLCILNERGCASQGHVHSIRMRGNRDESWISVPLHSPADKPCVQVWQSDPYKQGKRILCPDYTHRRCGVIAVAALLMVTVMAWLGKLIHHVTKKRATGWLSIQKPVLLVCSSEQSAHVYAVCALASVLQGELCASVRMALWDQSSERHIGAEAKRGVPDLGPLPWLYGQWEAVQKAEGKVLIVWSHEAKASYQKWVEKSTGRQCNEQKKEKDSKREVRLEKIRDESEKKATAKGRRVGKNTKGRAVQKQSEPSSVTEPVFMAAMACLQGALQKRNKDHGVALVYFRGLSQSKDIPKELRHIPRYCLPQDFRGLIQELGGTLREIKSEGFGWHCWPRLLSKIISLCLAKRLAQQLRTWLPQTKVQTHRKKTQELRPKSSQRAISDNKIRSGCKQPLLVSLTKSGTVLEQGSVKRLALESLVSPV